jgi:xanthine dehydrogenase accessory factor
MLAGAACGTRAAIVVATHADSDEDALDRLLRTEAGYVSLVASRRRAAVMALRLQQRGVPLERLARLKAPAGLDIGAESPDEIAVSILAEIIQHRRTAKPEPPAESTATEAEAVDPVCGMTVEIAGAAHRSELSGRIVYFCCAGCKTSFDREPAKYL